MGKLKKKKAVRRKPKKSVKIKAAPTNWEQEYFFDFPR